MTNPNFMADAAMKGAQWERAKGELRALVRMQGSYVAGLTGSRGPVPVSASKERWEELEAVVNEFIERVEDHALHE